MRRPKLIELPLQPGAVSDDTELAAKLRATDMDKVRSRGKRWETIEGWEAFNASGMSAGTARAIHSWADLDGNQIVAAASESAVNAWLGGSRLTITPKLKDVWLSAASVAYNGVDGEVLVTWDVYTPATDTSTEANHDLVVGDSVTISGFIEESTGDIALNGTFAITAVPSPSTFVIDCGTGSSLTPHIPFTVTVAYRSGVVTGTGDTTALRPSIPSFDNFGENLVFCRSDGTPVWYWQPSTSYAELLTNGTFTGSLTGWTAGTNWTASSNTARHTGTTLSSLSQSVHGILEGGKTYEMSFDITVFQSEIITFLVRVNTTDIFPPGIVASGITTLSNAVRTYTFRFVCPANPTTLSFQVDASGTAQDDLNIDNVSVKLLSIAHPINEAPQKNYSLFVDGNRILNLLGSVESDGDYSPALLRWSDQDNYREWVADTDNVAGEFPLGKGTLAVCGGQVGERNIILTDDAAYVAAFTRTGYSVVPVGQGCGGIGNRCLAIHNNRAFWASNSGFYAYDGAQVVQLDCPVKDKYVDKLKQYQENKTFAWLNVEYGEVWFHYAHTDVGSEVNSYISFNFLEEGNPWAFGTLNRTCMVRAGTYRNPIGIDTAGAIWFHERGTVFSGTGITLPFIETGYVTSGDGDRWLGCRRYYPDIERQTGNIEFTVTGKNFPQGQNNSYVVGPMTVVPGSDTIDFLVAARQLKFKWKSVPSTTAWRLGVVGLEIVAERERR